MNVLIVDDDQMICDGTARRLEKSGIQEITDITCAYSAEEAMAIFEKKTIHVLFSDIRMNGLTGLELIEAVKRLQPYVICIIVTAYDQFQYAQQAIRVGVHEFLVKPCSGREMRDQALHAVNRMQDSEPQRRRMLDEALRSAPSRQAVRWMKSFAIMPWKPLVRFGCCGFPVQVHPCLCRRGPGDTFRKKLIFCFWTHCRMLHWGC